MHNAIFTSESVTEGHPDKIADQISDAILDALLEQDPNSRVACETMVTTGMAVIAGEITTKGYVDLPEIVRETITNIGYTSSDMGFDAKTCAVISSIDKQSPDIALGVDKEGAGDQGMMFGYACNETPTLMPAPIYWAHKLSERLTEVRKNSGRDFLRPDGKTQVSFLYQNGVPVSIKNIVISTQHAEHVHQATLEEYIIDNVIYAVLEDTGYIADGTCAFQINPTGRFVIGGPMGDCGLTGRKIIQDTYGGMGRHGGGAFSGKDPSKVDRSGAYMARYIAKNIVSAELADRCEVQIAYCIGKADPVSVYVNTFGTGKYSDFTIQAAVHETFDMRPYSIIRDLDLLRPIYSKTSCYGHFGRQVDEFTWEKTDKVAALLNYF